MKKFFSALLILCMVFTSLSVGVSATYTKPVDPIKYNSFLFDSEYNISSDTVYNLGEWNLSNGTDPSVKLGTIAEYTGNFGMKFKKFVFNANTLSGATAGAKLSIRGEITKTTNYGTTYTMGDCGTEYITIGNLDTITGARDINDDGVIDANSGSVVKYTVYAYSKLEDGEPISFNFMRQANVYGSVFEVPASKLYSADEIPHKIDVVFYHNGSNAKPISTKTKNAEQNFEIWIDGLLYQHGNVSAGANDKTDFYVFLSPNINLVSDSEGVVSWKNSELYICSTPDGTTGGAAKSVGTNGGKYFKVYTRDTLHNELFQTATYESTPVATARTNFVTGVDSALAEDIENVYTTALSSGDRVVEVDQSIYNDPASIWTGNDSNVTLVNKAGNVFEAGDSVTGTFADYYIAVNGVYTKVVEKSFVNDYNIASKTATVNVSTLPEGTNSLQIIVAAYNENGTLAKVKASKVYTATELESNITYVIDDATFPTNAFEYKVFYFNSLDAIKPLMEALEK